MPNFCLKREKGPNDKQDDSDIKCRQCQKDLGQVSAYLNTADSFESIISILRGIISHKNSAKLHHSKKCCFSTPRVFLYVWGHSSKTEVLKVKTCGPFPWPTLTVCHIHACKVCISIKKRYYQQRWSLTLNCLI